MNNHSQTCNIGLQLSVQSETEFGMKLKTLTDVELLQRLVRELWDIIDDIDTTSDLAKNNDQLYRNLVHKSQKKRHDFLKTDGYELFLPSD